MKIIPVLFSPFQRIAGGPALGLGLAAIVVTALIGAPQGLHFDGVLDMHAGMRAPWWVFVGEGLINWISLALMLLAAGRLLSKTAFRSLDLFGTQALARWPTILIALACLAPGFHRYTEAIVRSLSSLKPGVVPTLPPGGADAFVFILVTVATLAGIVWMVALMWKSFSHCCNLRGGKAVGAFVVALIAAEVLSKVLIGFLFRAI